MGPQFRNCWESDDPISGLYGRPIKAGSLCSGTDLAWEAFILFVNLVAGFVIDVEHTMAVEIVKWKRDFLSKNYPKLKHLLADAKDLSNSFAYCYKACKEVGTWKLQLGGTILEFPSGSPQVGDFRFMNV